VNFINKDVKSHLGMRVNITPKKGRDLNSGNITPRSDNSSYLGGYLIIRISIIKQLFNMKRH